MRIHTHKKGYFCLFFKQRITTFITNYVAVYWLKSFNCSAYTTNTCNTSRYKCTSS